MPQKGKSRVTLFQLDAFKEIFFSTFTPTEHIEKKVSIKSSGLRRRPYAVSFYCDRARGLTPSYLITQFLSPPFLFLAFSHLLPAVCTKLFPPFKESCKL